jgi:hypothetical protein
MWGKTRAPHEDYQLLSKTTKRCAANTFVAVSY